MRLNGGKLGIGSSGKLRLETVLDHGCVGGGNEIEMDGLSGWHRNSGSFKAKSQPTTTEWSEVCATCE
jgi:hypothetical protein